MYIAIVSILDLKMKWPFYNKPSFDTLYKGRPHKNNKQVQITITEKKPQPRKWFIFLETKKGEQTVFSCNPIFSAVFLK